MLFLLCCYTKAQTPLYPDIYSSYAINKVVLTPSYIPTVGKYGMSGVYKFKPGESNIALYDMSAVLVSNLENSNKQVFRISFYNEKEGPYITSPRGYGNYAYQVAISQNTMLSAGVALGFVSKQFSAPSATGIGNAFMPDANAGLSLQWKQFHSSIAMYQLFQSEGKAIDAKLKLNSYYQFYVNQVVVLNELWQLKPQVLLRVLPQVTNQWLGGISLGYKKQLEVASIYTQRRGVAFQAIVKIDNTYLPISISVLYNSGLLSQTPVWLNSMEIGVDYIN